MLESVLQLRESRLPTILVLPTWKIVLKHPIPCMSPSEGLLLSLTSCPPFSRSPSAGSVDDTPTLMAIKRVSRQHAFCIYKLELTLKQKKTARFGEA